MSTCLGRTSRLLPLQDVLITRLVGLLVQQPPADPPLETSCSAEACWRSLQSSGGTCKDVGSLQNHRCSERSRAREGLNAAGREKGCSLCLSANPPGWPDCFGGACHITVVAGLFQWGLLSGLVGQGSTTVARGRLAPLDSVAPASAWPDSTTNRLPASRLVFASRSLLQGDAAFVMASTPAHDRSLSGPPPDRPILCTAFQLNGGDTAIHARHC